MDISSVVKRERLSHRRARTTSNSTVEGSSRESSESETRTSTSFSYIEGLARTAAFCGAQVGGLCGGDRRREDREAQRAAELAISVGRAARCKSSSRKEAARDRRDSTRRDWVRVVSQGIVPSRAAFVACQKESLPRTWKPARILEALFVQNAENGASQADFGSVLPSTPRMCSHRALAGHEPRAAKQKDSKRITRRLLHSAAFETRLIPERALIYGACLSNNNTTNN